MNVLKAGAMPAFVFLLQIFASCSGGGINSNISEANFSSQTNNPANTAKSNVEELGMLIKMPFETEEAVWRDEGKRLIAVIKLSASDADRLTSQAEKIKPPTAAQVNTEVWFPVELIAQGELSGDDTLRGTTYAADDFYQPPYTDGKLTRIENMDYFVLELTAKQ